MVHQLHQPGRLLDARRQTSRRGDQHPRLQCGRGDHLTRRCRWLDLLVDAVWTHTTLRLPWLVHGRGRGEPPDRLRLSERAPNRDRARAPTRAPTRTRTERRARRRCSSPELRVVTTPSACSTLRVTWRRTHADPPCACVAPETGGGDFDIGGPPRSRHGSGVGACAYTRSRVALRRTPLRSRAAPHAGPESGNCTMVFLRT